MSIIEMADKTMAAQPPRRPRIALMGEFSAGKSTLANLLLGQSVSPVKVTATQLPPVWYRHGRTSVLRVDNRGAEQRIAVEDLDAVSHRDTQAVCVSLQADVLEFCDLIDMPGTSDPNLPPDVWERMLDKVDGVVWCTPSTQAWRQTEAALWESLPDRLRSSSVLLITRIDKIGSETDRARIVARVCRESQGLFSTVIPISLTQALEAGEDAAALVACGADAFVASLLEIVEALEVPSADAVVFKAVESGPAISVAAPAERPQRSPETGVSPRRIVPKRVRRTPVRVQSGA